MMSIRGSGIAESKGQRLKEQMRIAVSRSWISSAVRRLETFNQSAARDRFGFRDPPLEHPVVNLGQSVNGDAVSQV